MELADGSTDIVHPEVRAHISSLVAALGGASAEEDGQYQLGDDALEVLRDIKRWIRFYDEKTNRMDVARCIHEANLVEGDLLPILSTWHENELESKHKSRIALSCFEVMVPLTWPMERDKERMTVNHHRHMPVLELAQIQYKRAIVNFDGARILHAAVRTALPSLALSAGDRTARDQGILKLVLFFLRNIAMIAPSSNSTYDGDETQISRSVTIDAFSYQDIFLFILTLASNMGDDFRTEDMTVMEIIFHLVKRVNIEKLFMNEQQVNKAKATELSSLMNKESAMLKSYNRNGTRHNRFGTMIWVQRDDGKMSSLSGQDALASASTRNRKMDNNKTFKPPRRGKKEDKDERDMGPPVKLNARANGQLRSFVEEFLDSGFNPLFLHVRKTIDREAQHVMQYHRRQFFYLVAWFLEAERVRRKCKKSSGSNKADDVSSFNLVAGVLNQEMFITLSKGMHEAYDYKDWHELSAVMRCFTQILLTVQEMMDSGKEEDEEIAENVLSRLFYEEATHDIIANIARTYKDQGFDYLDAATELVHHFLRTLEAYSKQNKDMQVRSRKRTRQKKKAAASAGDDDGIPEENEESADDEASAERTSKERKFDFQRFTARFTPQGVVDTFVKFARFYQDMTDTQLKRAHRYFYRLAFKQEMSVMLFRVDIIHLLYNMVKGPEPLDKASSMYKDWEELAKQIFRKCFKKIEQRPELIIEMLFSKLQSTAFFLEYGYERQTSTTKSQAKPAPELVFKYTEELDRQFAIVVGALLDKNEADHIAWVKELLTEAESERRAWTAVEEAMAPTENPFEEAADPEVLREAKKPPPFHIRTEDSARRTARFKNPHLRLLLNLCGFQLHGLASEETPESLWVLSEDVSAGSLKDALHYINQAEFSPPTFDDGQGAESQLKRKTLLRKRAEFDDDEGDDIDDDGFLFEPGGPTARKAIDESERPKKTRKRRRRNSQTQELDDEELEEKARKRREREREKARKIKSAAYVNEGDDEFDEDEDQAFFAREQEIAARAAKVAQSIPEPVAVEKPRKSKPLTIAMSDDDEGPIGGADDDDDDGVSTPIADGDADGNADSGSQPSRRRRAAIPIDSDSGSGSDSDSDSDSGDASPPMLARNSDSRKRRKVSIEADEDEQDTNMDDAPLLSKKNPEAEENDDDDADDAPVVVARRPRVRGGFVIDSDDEEE